MLDHHQFGRRGCHSSDKGAPPLLHIRLQTLGRCAAFGSSAGGWPSKTIGTLPWIGYGGTSEALEPSDHAAFQAVTGGFGLDRDDRTSTGRRRSLARSVMISTSCSSTAQLARAALAVHCSEAPQTVCARRAAARHPLHSKFERDGYVIIGRLDARAPHALVSELVNTSANAIRQGDPDNDPVMAALRMASGYINIAR